MLHPRSTMELGEKLLHLKLIQFVVNIVTQFCNLDILTASLTVNLHLLLIIISMSDICLVVDVVVWKIFLSSLLVHLVGPSHLSLPRLQSVKEEIKRHSRPWFVSHSPIQVLEPITK